MPSRKKKGSEKSKQKKKERKERMERELAGKAVVKKGNEMEDVFSILTAFKSYKKLGIEAAYKRHKDLTEEEKDWVFNLLEKNMKTLYDGCKAVGWDASGKKKELKHDDARFVIAYDEADNETKKENENSTQRTKATKVPVGFVMLRYLMDDNGYDELIPVLYLWEIQLEAAYRRKGLGKFLMTIAELAAWKIGVKKICMTVFTNNTASMKFFKDNLKYKVDETDPTLCEPDEPHCGYTILSKVR